MRALATQHRANFIDIHRARLHAAVRREAAALTGDRPLTADIERVAAGIREGKFEPEGGTA